MKRVYLRRPGPRLAEDLDAHQRMATSSPSPMVISLRQMGPTSALGARSEIRLRGG